MVFRDSCELLFHLFFLLSIEVILKITRHQPELFFAIAQHLNRRMVCLVNAHLAACVKFRNSTGHSLINALLYPVLLFNTRFGLFQIRHVGQRAIQQLPVFIMRHIVQTNLNPALFAICHLAQINTFRSAFFFHCSVKSLPHGLMEHRLYHRKYRGAV